MIESGSGTGTVVRSDMSDGFTEKGDSEQKGVNNTLRQK